MRTVQEMMKARGRVDVAADPSTSGTDRRWQITMLTTAKHSQMVTSCGTEHLLHEISYLSQDRPDLKFASMQVCCAMANPSVRDMERVKRSGRYLFGKPRARRWFRWQPSGELESYSDGDWGGDKATRRSVSAGVIMRGEHCFKVWTKNQHVSLSSAESELYAAVKTASEGFGI